MITAPIGTPQEAKPGAGGQCVRRKANIIAGGSRSKRDERNDARRRETSGDFGSSRENAIENDVRGRNGRDRAEFGGAQFGANRPAS